MKSLYAVQFVFVYFFEINSTQARQQRHKELKGVKELETHTLLKIEKKKEEKWIAIDIVFKFF